MHILEILNVILAFIWGLLNTPAGVTLIGSAVAYVAARLFAAKPAWVKYEGSIITAIKLAEKMIPDDTQNPGLDKLNKALGFVLVVYEDRVGKPADKKALVQLREGVQIVHDRLEKNNTL